ncbi:HAMP domain-containing sensor histidine kinase [Pseudonocardia halophobica]|uniref:histidine kinase n=1 Tax=Pseudonocardia halophobica TaxID=29401 RepID=A0A9W6L3B1_9PSEU|nr:HAMP domain-containing sensor histidine kinase [Pseudonocardia halophobica]GLL12288.1 two-component sensor histidine kinase [Pseudonocardia halophobica]
MAARVTDRVVARSRTLRARLVVTVLLLIALACAVIGVATAIALRSFLYHRLDEDVLGAAARFQFSRYEPAPPGLSRADSFLGPAQKPGTLGAVVRAGVVEEAAVTDRRGSSRTVPEADVAQLGALRPGDHPRTVSLSLGDYHAVAVSAPDGTVLVLGQPAQEVADIVNGLVVIELIVIGAALGGAAIAATVLVRRELRPLEEVAGIAAKVSAMPLDRGEVELATRVPEPDEHTEVGQVGAALNRMLDNVEGALEARQDSETRLRRFVADASHELRTPLAAIRGYAELTRRDGAALPEGTAHALTRISSQAERMSTLVEDLLLLARLDAGRPLERAPVDLTRLVLDAVSDAHAAGPGHRWQLDLPEEPVTVPGDASRLTQVLTNLLANARTHTPEGTEVTVGLGVSDGSALLSVVDTGPGIPADLQPHVFERFARGSAGRARAVNNTASTGLGLAIVDAVVAAHGGRVGLESRPGCTEFRVTLPLTPAAVPAEAPARV